MPITTPIQIVLKVLYEIKREYKNTGNSPTFTMGVYEIIVDTPQNK